MSVKEKNKEKIDNAIETLENNVIASNKTKNEINNSKKRDASIELIRIVACIMVVLTHLSLNVFNQYYSQVDWSRLFEKCFFTDGVPIFYMIIGFFLVNGRSYKKIWKSTAKNVLLPTFIYVIFSQIFYMFIINKQSFLWCLENIKYNLNILGIFRSIITGDVLQINSVCAHLWYIFSYVKIVIWIPILWLVCKENDNSKLARKLILIFGVIAIIIKDILRFINIDTLKINVFEFVNIDIFYVLLGYELFIHKDKIKNNKKICMISSIVFVFINILRYKIEMQYMVNNNFYDIVGRENFIDWKHTSLSIISSLAIFMALYSIDIKNEKLSNIILWVANKTFGIYLIHYLLLAKIDLYKFDKIGKIVHELIYLIIGTITIFISSLLIIWLLRIIKNFIINMCQKIIYKKVK